MDIIFRFLVFVFFLLSEFLLHTLLTGETWQIWCDALVCLSSFAVSKFKFTFLLEAGFVSGLVESVMKRLKRKTFQLILKR